VTDEPPNTADHEERIAELERAVLALKIIVVGLFIGQAGDLAKLTAERKRSEARELIADLERAAEDSDLATSTSKIAELFYLALGDEGRDVISALGIRTRAAIPTESRLAASHAAAALHRLGERSARAGPAAVTRNQVHREISDHVLRDVEQTLNFKVVIDFQALVRGSVAVAIQLHKPVALLLRRHVFHAKPSREPLRNRPALIADCVDE
jgi:hypothetical protein